MLLAPIPTTSIVEHPIAFVNVRRDRWKWIEVWLDVMVRPEVELFFLKQQRLRFGRKRQLWPELIQGFGVRMCAALG